CDGRVSPLLHAGAHIRPNLGQSPRRAVDAPEAASDGYKLGDDAMRETSTRSAAGAALIAAASILVWGASSAQAADLGGDCCADLEERIAELEATTARKGNRKVSLSISGWVNEAV